MRVLRLVWNWARSNQRTGNGEAVLGPNPVGILNKRERGPGQRGWNNVPRKESIIPKKRLPDWFAVLRQVPGQDATTEARRVSCLLLEALALTGLRFSELATLPWSRVDLGMGTITIPDTTSKNRRPLVRPITRRVGEILGELRRDYSGELVFPGRVQGQPLNNTRKLQLELQARTGLWITPHDLRRVWASAATRAGLPAVAVKRLLNHMGHEEVTEGYIRLGLDELLDYSQAVEDTILGDAGLLASRNLDNRLQDLLAALPEDEKRRLLFELAGRQLGEVC
jgi:integrase